MLFENTRALRGVVVPAGVHVVRFELRSTSFRAGAAASLATALALATWTLVRRARRRRRGPGALQA